MSNANGSATASNFIPARIEWRGAYGGLPPFQSATPAEIEATYIFSAKALRNSMTRIAEQSQPPTFDNTIAEIDRAWEAFAEAETLYGVFRFSKLDDAMATVQERLAPLRSNLQDWIAQYDKLFARVAAVRTTASLKGAQQRLTELVYADFKKRGGGLPIAHRQRLEEINTRIAKLEAEFQRLLMQDLEKTGHEITDRTDLSGLDPGTCAILEQVAEKRGLAGGAIVPCARPIVDQILVKSRSRSLREAVWRMWEARGRATTLPVVTEILRLRGEKARLLGFSHYADLETSDRMAGCAQAALDLELAIARAAAVQAEHHDRRLEDFARNLGFDARIEAWDRPFYNDQLRAETFGFDTDELMDYLSLDGLVDGMFWAAGQLYRLTFNRLEGIPRLCEDITVFEVARDGKVLGVLWLDLFTRPGKRPLAWMHEFRMSHVDRPALVSINHYLPKPSPGETVLVNWENARVLFHEMGHALHALLAQAPYYLLGMQFVAWDIIELPSQIFEHLLTSPELLSRFARHHKTGEPMPDRMIRYLQNNASFDPGAWSLHVGAPAIIDLRLHQSTMEDDIGPASIEAEALAEIPMPRTIDPRHSVANFSHIFAERYAAGYYCYHWADMMVADTLEIFLASPGGFLDRATARRFEQKLLSIAHAVPAREAYRDFAGHDPQIGTLMRKLCLAG